MAKPTLVFSSLRKKGVQEAQVTLHVSAGTFQPIKVDNVLDHPMHQEQIQVDIQTIQKLLTTEGPIVAVGTTSVRTLESLYWFGVKLLEGKSEEVHISKLFAYENRSSYPSRKEAMEKILTWMKMNGKQALFGSTEIFIFPGYQYRMIDGLITNFHQPGSTLVLLIATILGEDWKKVYQEALAKEYRFLSYGDSSLLWI